MARMSDEVKEYYIIKAIDRTFTSCGKMYRVLDGFLIQDPRPAKTSSVRFVILNLHDGSKVTLHFDDTRNDEIRKFVSGLK